MTHDEALAELDAALADRRAAEDAARDAARREAGAIRAARAVFHGYGGVTLIADRLHRSRQHVTEVIRAGRRADQSDTAAVPVQRAG